MQDDITAIDDFFSYFLEEKNCFANSAKGNFVTSLCKFYKSMAKHGKITQEQYKDVMEFMYDLCE